MADQMTDQTDAATGADTGEGDTPDASGGYCIEIKVGADGKVSVGVEPQSAEDSEGEDEENYQPVDSFAAAIKVAKEIYAHAGNMQDMGAGMDEMSAGYGAKAGA